MARKSITSEVNRSSALRQALKTAVENGITYQEICERIPDELWNRNSLKQLAHRESVVRPSAKIAALVETILQLYREHRKLQGPKEQISLEIGLLSYFINGEPKREPKVSNSFRRLFQESIMTSLPDRFAFVRFGRDKKKMIVVQVKLHREEKNAIFTMKISGKGKRLIMGQVLHTQPITYLCGIAYPVAIEITDEDFAELNTDNFDNDQSFISTPIGAETIAIKNSDIPYGVTPAAFMGLDGWGNPFTGNGVIVPEGQFERYDIPSHIVSSVDCAENNTPLKELLEKAEGDTVKYPQGGAPALLMSVTN